INTLSPVISPALHVVVMSSRRMEEGGTLLPVIPIVHVGCDGGDSSALICWAVSTGATGVTGPGPATGLIRTTATTITTTTMSTIIIRYGVRALFFFRTARQFGQEFWPGSTGAPQRGQVFNAIYTGIRRDN